MNDIQLVCVIDDKADLASIRRVLDCAVSRAPKIGRLNMGAHTSILEMTWVRLDSPKREASLRISCLEAQKARPGSAEDMRAMAIEVLELALSDNPGQRVDDPTLHRWHADLKDLGAYAAIRQNEADPAVSRADFCHASAGTAWADAMGDRPGIRGNNDVIRTIEADRVRKMLPDLPRIVLVRNASTNGRGRSHVGLGALHGGTSFMDLDEAERTRLDARFRHLDR